MSNQTNDGGPAGGMSLHDWFAGQALMGLIAAQGPRKCIEISAKEVSDHCAIMADAMINRLHPTTTT